MPRLLIFIRYERRFPILIFIFNHYFIWQSKHNDDRQYLDLISEHLLQVHSLSLSPSSFQVWRGKKKKPWDWASSKDFAGQEHQAHQSLCFPKRKLWWIVGCDLWPFKKEVCLHSKGGTVLAQIVSLIEQDNPMKVLAAPSLLTFWLWQQDERGMGKLNIHCPPCISPGRGKQVRGNM